MSSKEDLEVLFRKEDFEVKNCPEDSDHLPLKKRKILTEEPKSKPNHVEEETNKMTASMGNGNHNHRNRLMEDLKVKSGPQDPNLPLKKRKIFQELESKPDKANEEQRKLTAVTNYSKDRSHCNCSTENLESKNRCNHCNRLTEDLEAKNGPQDCDLPLKKRNIFQEPESKPNQANVDTRELTTVTNSKCYVHRNHLMEDLEAKNRPQDPDLPPLKKRKIFQEPKNNPSLQVEEESRTTITTTTSNGKSRHYNDHPHKKLYTEVQPSKELMQTLSGLGIDWHHHLVPVLRKTLCESDVNRDQNRLQHSEKEVREVLLGMMTEEEKQLVMQEGAGDGLRVTVLDRQARKYHMNFKMIRSIKYFRFRGPGYHNFVVDNNLKRGEILETHAVRVQRRRDGPIGEEGAQGIMDGELLLLMINYGDDSDEKNFNKELQMLSPDEKETLDALLLLQKKVVIFCH